jgi:hypothetical protein
MNVFLSILAVVCTLVGAMGSLMLFVLCIAGAPNSSPAQIVRIKLYMLATALGGVAIVACACTLIAFGHPSWASVVGIVPMAALIGLFIYCEVSRG